MKHALVVAVAVAYVALSLSEGGHPLEVVAASTLIVWWAVIVGLAVGAFPRADVPGPAIAAGVSIVGLGLLTALSLGWADDGGRAFIEVVRVAGYAGLFVLVVLSSRRGSARAWLLGLGIGLAVVAVIALGSRLEPSLVPGHDREIANLVSGARGRLSYPIGYWNGLGAALSLGTVLLVWFGTRGASRLGRALAVGGLVPVFLAIHLTSSRGAVVAAALGVAVLFALGPARIRIAANLALAAVGAAVLIALTDLRSFLVDDPTSPAATAAGDEILLATVIIAALVAIGRYVADGRLERLAMPRVPRLARRAAVVGAALVAIAAVVAADPAHRFEEFKQPPQEEVSGGSVLAAHRASTSGSGRYQFWSAAVGAFAAQPITGIGAGGYEAWWNQHGAIARTVRDAHSLYLETLGELGVGGLLLVLSFLGLGAVYGWRRKAGGSPGGTVEAALALLATGAFSAAFEWTWELPAVFGPVVVAVALLTGAATLPGRNARGPIGGAGSDDGAATGGARRSFGWGVLTLLTGWVAVWIAALLLLTESKLADSRAAADRFEYPAAAQDAADASTLQPWAAEPRLQWALVEEAVGNTAAARQLIDAAIERAPEDWSLWYVASRIDSAAGNEDAAAEAYERARSLNPRATIFAVEGEGSPGALAPGVGSPVERTDPRDEEQTPQDAVQAPEVP